MRDSVENERDIETERSRGSKQRTWENEEWQRRKRTRREPERETKRQRKAEREETAHGYRVNQRYRTTDEDDKGGGKKKREKGKKRKRRGAGLGDASDARDEREPSTHRDIETSPKDGSK